MAKAKKVPAKAGKRPAARKSASGMASNDSVLVLALTWVFTLLSVVFAIVAYWQYA